MILHTRIIFLYNTVCSQLKFFMTGDTCSDCVFILVFCLIMLMAKWTLTSKRHYLLLLNHDTNFFAIGEFNNYGRSRGKRSDEF